MDSDRRLSEEDVSLVLRRAGEMTAEQGMTVAQVQEIARDVGLSPEAVQRALAEAASGALRPAHVERSFGLPVAISKEVSLPGTITEDGWDVLVSVLRATFTATGKERPGSVVREWRNGNLRIALEPTSHGHRLRMSTDKAQALRARLLVSGIFLIEGVASLAVSDTARLTGVGLLLAGIGAAALAWTVVSLPKWARLRSAQFDEIAREAAALAAEHPGPAAVTDGTGDSGLRRLTGRIVGL